MNGLALGLACVSYMVFCAAGIRSRIRLYARGLTELERILLPRQLNDSDRETSTATEKQLDVHSRRSAH